jgi:hypothetical protein
MPGFRQEIAMRRTFITAATWTAFLFAIYLFLGYTPAAPDSIGEGEVCFRCRRVITNARLAAEMMDRNLPTKYKTAGCMAVYVATHPGTGARYYVTDFASGALIPAERAFYVRVLINDRTGERDYRAYYSRGMADIAAQEFTSTVVGWDTVVEAAKAKA